MLSTTEMPRWQQTIVLLIVFCLSFAGAARFLPVIGDIDWRMFSQGLRYQLAFENPYFLTGEGLDTYEFYYPPWAVVFLWPIANFPASWILGLDVALWLVFIMAMGRPPALLLVLHPMFLMLLASANIELVGMLLGMWLLLNNVQGWQKGVALLLIAIKPQSLILLLLLEGLRTLYQRDWQAIAVMAVGAGVPFLLFPQWLPFVFGTPDEGWVWSFSVIGIGGLSLALIITAVIVYFMRRRLNEWRTLAIFLSYVWTPYVLPFSYVGTFFTLRNASWLRIGAFIVLSCAVLPLYFQDFHTLERAGAAIMLLLAVALSPRDPSQTEAALAQTT